jgi:hypothetical protein
MLGNSRTRYDGKGRVKSVWVEVVMSVLRYECPNTSIEVTTGIDTEGNSLERMRKLKISVWCPYCATSHSIPAEEMYFSSKITVPLMTKT